jgi:DNA-nicking Smr family endonuclease
LNLIFPWCINLVVKEDDSIYRLLSGLSNYTRKEVAPQEIPREKTVCDEMTLFHQAMRDVKEIDHRNHRITRKADKIHCSPHDPDDEKQMRDAIEDHRSFPVTNLPEYMEGQVEGLNPLTMEKLRSGEFSVQKVLDLHGYSAVDAYALFQEFIGDAVLSGLNCVKVIHGRGLKSREAPVLKEKLKEWIVKAMHRKWVIAFSSAQMREGGPGATCILLRRRPQKKRIHIAG